MPTEKISADPAVQHHYEHCLAEGTPPVLAEMFALGQAPGSRTDREFWAGLHWGEKDPVARDHYARLARRDGVDTAGKIYLSQLAEHPGDPRAWVSDRHDVRKVCEERGYGCTGDVTVKGREITRGPQPAPLGEDIVQREVERLTKQDPGLAYKDQRELHEMVREQHSGPAQEK